MPEGPSLVILKELVASFDGNKLLSATGTSKIDMNRLSGKKLTFKTWGKHFLICFPDFTIRIHFLLFGSYLINEKKEAIPRLTLHFKKGFINFYACAVKMIEEPLDELYDWRADIMSDEWDARAARAKLKASPNMLACDALLDQSIFSGSGNIIKNEVLYRIKVHPMSQIGALPPKKLSELINETRNYSFDFLRWKKAFVLRKNWLAHTKKICKRCEIPINKEYLGRTQRRTFYCPYCQDYYGEYGTV